MNVRALVDSHLCIFGVLPIAPYSFWVPLLMALCIFGPSPIALYAFSSYFEGLCLRPSAILGTPPYGPLCMFGGLAYGPLCILGAIAYGPL